MCSQKTIVSLEFKFPTFCCLLLLAGNLNFKLRIVFWNIIFGDLKNESHSEKSHLYEVVHLFLSWLVCIANVYTQTTDKLLFLYAINTQENV